jgi:hypothetical protein
MQRRTDVSAPQKIYPARRWEKLAAVFLVLLMFAGIGAGAAQRVERPNHPDTWEICIKVGFIISWTYCWDIGKPKVVVPNDPPAPCPPPSCDPQTQSCP